MASTVSSNERYTDADAKSNKGRIEGRIYEKLTLALLAKKGYELSKDANSNISDFAIGREVDIGDDAKFDDVVFRYKSRDNTINLIFLQIKHKQDDCLINSDILSTKSANAHENKNKGAKVCNISNMRKDFYLQKYFISFLNIRKKLKTTQSKELNNGKLKYAVIFTNSDLDIEDLEAKGFKLKPAPDDIVDLFTLKKPSSKKNKCNNCYQFDTVNRDLLEQFKASSDLYRLARELAKYAIWENHMHEKIMGTDTSLIKYYHVALGNKVIEKSNQVMTVKRQAKSKTGDKFKTSEIKYFEGQFRKDFIDNDEPGPDQELKEAIFQAIREIDKSQTNASDTKLRDVKWNLAPNFGETKNIGNPHLFNEWNTIDEKDIQEFLNCLVFVVNQPRMKELEALINESNRDIVVEGSSFQQIIEKIENTGPEIREKLEKSLGIYEKTVHEEGWISGEEIIKFVENQKQLINESLLVTAMTLIHKSETMQYGEFKETSKLAEEFLKSNSNILCVYTPSTLLTSIKILQFLKNERDYNADNVCISINSDILKYEGNRSSILNVFETKNKNLLIIECRYVINEQDVKEFYDKLFLIIKHNPRKKVVLIIEQDKHNILAENFKNNFYRKNMYNEEKDEINLKYFQPIEDPMKKELIVFQEKEKKVSLGSLIGLDTWDRYVYHLSKFGTSEIYPVLDLVTMVKLLKNEQIIVGSKPFNTSFLEGAYATLFEEINLDALKHTLLHENNTQYKFVFTGITESEEESKKEKLINLLGLGNERNIIEKKVGHIGSDSEIQIADDHFEDGNFEHLCHSYPENIFYWIQVNSEDNKYQYALQKLYDPTFYVERNYKKIVFNKNLKELLMKHDLSESFIFLFESKLLQETDIEFVCMRYLNLEPDILRQIRINTYDKFISFFTDEYTARKAFYDHSYGNKTVHMIKYERRQFIWWDSRGSIVELRKYIDRNQCNKYLTEEFRLLYEIGDRKVMLIADNSGMGKSTTLTKLCENFRIAEYHWVIRINLKDHLQVIRNELKDVVLENVNDHNVDEFLSYVVEFLSKVDIKLNDSLAKNLLRSALKGGLYSRKPPLLAFDGFDEVLDEKDRAKIISLLKFLKEKTTAKIWITTRLHLRETLEDALGTFAIELHPLDEEQKKEYVEKYLKPRLRLILNKQKFEDCFNENKKILKYTDAFFSKMKSVFTDKSSAFIGNPLQLYLMLEGCIGHFKMWIENNYDDPNFDYLGNNTYEIYKNFIDRKYDIYFKKINVKDQLQESQEKFILNMYNKELAESVILDAKPRNTFDKFKNMILCAGIIKCQYEHDEFIHPSFLAYFAAKAFIHWIKNETNKLLNSNKVEYLLREIFMKPDYELIRTFLNTKLRRVTETRLSEETWKQFGNIIVNMWKQKENPLITEEVTVLHITVSESNSQIFWFLSKCLKDHKDVFQELLFKYSRSVGTSLHIACQRGDREIIKALLDSTEDIPEYAFEELLTLCISESNASYQTHAIEQSVYTNQRYEKYAEILSLVLKQVKNKLQFFMSENHYASVVICFNSNEEIAKVLFDGFKDDEDSLKKLLLYRYEKGNSLYWAVASNSLVEHLLSLARKICDNNETLKKLLLNEGGEPLLNRIMSFKCIDIVKNIINAAKNIHDDNHTLQHILLRSDFIGNVRAAAKIDYNIVILLLKTVADLNEGEVLLEQYFFAKSKLYEDAIKLIAKNSDEDIVEDTFENILKDFFKPIFKDIFEEAYFEAYIIQKEMTTLLKKFYIHCVKCRNNF